MTTDTLSNLYAHIPTRPDAENYDVVQKASIELAQKITRWDDPFTKETLAELILDAYQHNFLNNGFQIYEYVKSMGGIEINPERHHLFDLIEDTIERIATEDEAIWFKEHKHDFPKPFLVGTPVSYKGRTGTVVGISDDRPASYRVELDLIEHDEIKKEIIAPFELTQQRNI